MALSLMIPFTPSQPYEGRWPRYRREVCEAASYLAPLAPTLPHDTQRALSYVTTWLERQRPALPPEPYASIVRAAAIQHAQEAQRP